MGIGERVYAGRDGSGGAIEERKHDEARRDDPMVRDNVLNYRQTQFVNHNDSLGN